MVEKKQKMVFLNDIIAKKIFKNKVLGKKLSARVISDILGINYDDVYNNLELSSEEIAFSALTVNSTADVIYSSNTIYFNIEINYRNYQGKKRQLESYVYQLYLSQIHTYKDYNNIKEIIQISIDAFDYFGKDEFIYNIYLMEDKYNLKLSDRIHMIHINLAKLEKMDYNIIISGRDNLQKDLYFLICNDNDKLNLVYKGDKLMKDVIENAKQIAGAEKMNLYLTEEEMLKIDQEYAIEQGIQQGIEKGIQQGIEKGIQKNKCDMIMNMYKKKYSLEIISDCTNLSIDDVKKIIENEQKK